MHVESNMARPSRQSRASTYLSTFMMWLASNQLVGYCPCILVLVFYLHRQADKLDEETNEAQSSLLQMAAGAEATVDEKNSAIIVFNSSGIIQMVNKVRTSWLHVLR